MRLSSPDPGRSRISPPTTPRSKWVLRPGARSGFRTRLAEAICRELPGGAALKDTVKRSAPARQDHWKPLHLDPEQGSAVVEFTFLALLLMVPLVYFVITVGQIQGGSFAVVGAADQGAKVYVAQSDASTAEAAAERAVELALADFGHQPDRASMTTTCNPADCQAAGSTVTVTVNLKVPLPFIPFAEGLAATELEASSTQLVGRYR
ncbi:hypothetical protein NG819_10965 [Pseudarthrobacter sp. Fe7]|nr:hypothetical protein NG819_10965 [Pseudarthrobacter sp. Fe7]